MEKKNVPSSLEKINVRIRDNTNIVNILPTCIIHSNIYKVVYLQYFKNGFSTSK